MLPNGNTETITSKDYDLTNAATGIYIVQNITLKDSADNTTVINSGNNNNFPYEFTLDNAKPIGTPGQANNSEISLTQDITVTYDEDITLVDSANVSYEFTGVTNYNFTDSGNITAVVNNNTITISFGNMLRENINVQITIPSNFVQDGSSNKNDELVLNYTTPTRDIVQIPTGTDTGSLVDSPLIMFFGGTNR